MADVLNLVSFPAAVGLGYLYGRASYAGMFSRGFTALLVGTGIFNGTYDLIVSFADWIAR